MMASGYRGRPNSGSTVVEHQLFSVGGFRFRRRIFLKPAPGLLRRAGLSPSGRSHRAYFDSQVVFPVAGSLDEIADGGVSGTCPAREGF